MAEPALEVIDVSARYASQAGRAESVLTGVTLAVQPGETLAILGPNGAGKSTLLRVLAGTLLPEQGEVRLFGAPLRGMGRRDVAREVAFVTQSEDVRFAFTVREIVMMGRAPHQGTSMRASAADQKQVDDLLEECDLVGLADRAVAELSGGEQKRVAIARAFAQSTRVLLLDEPTSSLDVPHQVRLFTQLGRATARDRKACVVVTHDLQLAAAHATRVALMKRGRLLAVGPVAEVLSEGRLREAFDWPIDTATLPGTNARVFVPRPEEARPGLN